MANKFTFFIIFSTAVQANSEEFSYVYKHNVVIPTKLSMKAPIYIDSNGKWFVDMEKNIAYYYPSPNGMIKFFYDPLNKEAYIFDNGVKTVCGETKINRLITCRINNLDYFKLSIENLQHSSDNIRKVASGSHHWNMWNDDDPYTVAYTQNKSLTFDKATMRFLISGVECDAKVNGKPWVFNRQLKYNRVSVDIYQWSIVDKHDAILYCGGVRAKLSGLYNRIKHLDNRSEYAKRENIN